MTSMRNPAPVERPILFSGEMIRAILDGRKTVTRRALKMPHGYWETSPSGELIPVPVNCPYGQPGDQLWVRETWSDVNLSGAPGIAYRADGDVRDLMDEPGFLDDEGAFNYDDERVKRHHFAAWYGDLISGAEGRWRPSIHMPRWVSRIQLEITSVRVERLQDGDGETAFESRYLAEGIHRIHHGDGNYYYHAFKNVYGPGNWVDPFDAWRELWQSINGPESWEANPWVWVVEFRRINPR